VAGLGNQRAPVAGFHSRPACFGWCVKFTYYRREGGTSGVFADFCQIAVGFLQNMASF
jgi:hypothetical protein